MPRRSDLQSILLIGSGPIVIGQACEFDYSGTQAVKALKEEGYRVILVNSNPATIMTDPELADRTYVEPITPEFVERIIAKERPDALLPTLGGQTALNVAVALHELGVLERYGVEMLGADYDVINKAEDRGLFRTAVGNCDLDVPRSTVIHTLDEARAALDEIGLPCVLRPGYTMGGSGGGIAYNIEEFERIVTRGLRLSRTSEILVEESILGWKEFELEVMRDRKDNTVVVCSIENLDPMGVHTGDSITVAPAQTLTDREYQRLRNAALAIMREIGVECGGSNVQFAVNPEDGRVVIIEMNPRVSRSSALASKATGFPIAKFAAKLAVGYTLDEIQNDITKVTPACFEPTLDYVVVKMPRFAFAKFPGCDPLLGTQMKSVGETMAIGRTFEEAFQKALRGLEVKHDGFEGRTTEHSREEIPSLVARPQPGRLLAIYDALEAGFSCEELHRLSGIDLWFLSLMERLARESGSIPSLGSLDQLDADRLRELKRRGYSDSQIASGLKVTQHAVREHRHKLGVLPGYRIVDTCAGEFQAHTPYLYSTYDCDSEEALPSSGKRKVVILGGGPNRIGQGIEFDYCCVHASLALREEGIESIMVNSNPETVSTDFDISDRLYFEPLTAEDVVEICLREKPEGVITQFGGQTPLNLAAHLTEAGIPLLGTSSDAIDRAEDRERFAELLDKLGLNQAPNGIAFSAEQALEVADRLTYPVVVRPSYVLGGRGMEIVHHRHDLEEYMRLAVLASPEHPVLVDKFLEDAIELDVDCVSDGTDVRVCAVMEHVEEAGIHSGDSTCSIPTRTLDPDVEAEVRKSTRALALELEVIGLMNVQYAIREGVVYVLEVNPRASRTVPYVAKATGIPWAKIATKVVAGTPLAELDAPEFVPDSLIAVKAPSFPFARFPGARADLGPEMRSTGEVMGLDATFAGAFAKAQDAIGLPLPTSGRVFISVRSKDKDRAVVIGRELAALGYRLVATSGTWLSLDNAGIPAERVNKVYEGRPDVVDLIKNRQVDLIVNTPVGQASREDDSMIRIEAYQAGIPVLATITSGEAAIQAIRQLQTEASDVRALQDCIVRA